MVEKVYKLSDEARIEKVILDQNLHYLHMRLPASDCLPVHRTNGNVHMTVLGGTLTIALEGNPARVYERGTILAIPGGVQMDVQNRHSELLELTVVKAPAPTT